MTASTIVSISRGMIILLVAAALGACGIIEDRSRRYVDAPAGEPLKTPDGKPLPRQRQAYPVRDIDGRGTLLAGDVPEPPDMTSDILDQNYVVEQLDDQVWLLVNEVPGRIWPAVNAWMEQAGLGVAQGSAQLGLLQSEVANFSKRARELLAMDAASGNEELMLVQARITPGVRRKTTEIQLRPQTVPQAPDQLRQWQDTPMDIELERKLLQQLSAFLQEREDSKSYSRAALGIASEPRVNLERDNDRPVAIVMELAYDRAWNELRRALDEAGIPVIDLDRSNGYFLVDGRPPETREAGWFNWLTGGPPEPEATVEVRVERQQDQVRVNARKAPEYNGEDRSTAFLGRLFDYLY